MVDRFNYLIKLHNLFKQFFLLEIKILLLSSCDQILKLFELENSKSKLY